MKWERLGRIFHVDALYSWMHSHATLPIPVHQKDDIFRIYFNTRDTKNRSHGAFVDINLKFPTKPIAVSKESVISPGEIGLFDDCGVTLSCFNRDNGLFYYMGWNLMQTVPFSNQIGAANFKGEKLEKFSKHPIFGKCEEEPLSFGYPWVLKHNNFYHMWYDTILEWKDNSTTNYRFILRSATSENGKDWSRSLHTGFHFNDNECAIARPCVLFEDQIFKMWYSINNNGIYKLGYAESKDGLNWVRKDELAGLSPSGDSWDSEEISYPYVFDHKGERFMLYNGNKYGKTGFGIAKLLSTA